MSGRSRLLNGVSLATLVAALAILPAHANPDGGRVVGGAATIAGEGTSHVTVTQSTDRAIIEWDSFSIGAGETTRFLQPGAYSIIANRVVGQDPSQILGALEANGKVVLVNRNGILFGQGARVDAAGLIATTHDFDDAEFMAGGGTLRFRNGGVADASVVNEGTITVHEAGMAALVAPHVRNSGTIVADLGRVALGGGAGFTLDLYGDGLINFAAGDAIEETLTDSDGTPLKALVENDGEIRARGGKVLLSASAAREVVNQSVNTSGIVRAQSISQSDGVITLSGSGAVKVEQSGSVSTSGTAGGGRIDVEAGSFSNAGTVSADGTDEADGGSISITADAAALGGMISASGAAGGSISVNTAGLLSLAEKVQAKGGIGAGGTIMFDAGRIVEISTGSTDVSGATDGGTISAAAETQFSTSGTYNASGENGVGGWIDITASDLRLLSSDFIAEGEEQGGLVRIGGAFQGGKAPDESQPYHDSFSARWVGAPALANATQTFINDSSRIDVGSAGGMGGTAIVWSDQLTTFLGAVNATGATGGGSVEISSAEDLRRADLGSVQVGAGGHLLIDPKNIIIGIASEVSAWAYAGIIGAGYTGNDISGLEAGDQFGQAVSLNADGDRLAVGSRFDDGFGNGVSNAGAVYLFSFADTEFSGGALESMIGDGYTGGKNIDVTALDANDYFGTSVSLNAAGDRLAVGVQGDTGFAGGLSGAGAVHLFSFTDGNFSGGTLEGTIGVDYSGAKDVDVTNVEGNDSFGGKVSLNAAGDRLAVGATGDDGAGNSTFGAGAAYLFSFTDTNFSGAALEATIGAGYSDPKDIDLTELDLNDSFGAAVSLNGIGDRLAVGSAQDNGSDNTIGNSGAVHLFSFTDTSFSGGVLEATIGAGYSGPKDIDVTTLESLDFFGTGVSLNAAGNRLAVGAIFDDGASNTVTHAGAVYLFSFADSDFNSGILEATLGAGYTGGKNIDVTALDSADRFGIDVSLNATGDRLVVGAQSDDGTGDAVNNVGAVHLFTFTDTNFSGGTHVGTLGAGYTDGKNIDVTGLEAGDGFGIAAALNAAGDRLAVGSEWDNGASGGADTYGAVYLFSFADSHFSGGVLEATIGSGYSGGKNVDLAGLEAGDGFGYSVSLNAAGDRLAVGAIADDGFGNGVSDAGAVYLFSFADHRFSSGVHEATIGADYSGPKDFDLTALDPDDHFGISVSLNAAGDRLAAGSWFDDGVGNGTADVGAAYLFSFTDTSFSSVALEATLGAGYSGPKDLDLTVLDPVDFFGTSVALNAAGDRLAVGATLDDGSSGTVTQSGAVHLFSFTDTSFSGGVLEATIGAGYSGPKDIDLTALEPVDVFGQSVSLNAAGNRLAVGAYLDDGAGNTLNDAGAVYLFSFTDADFSGGTLEATIGAGYTGGKNVSVGNLGWTDQLGHSVSLNAAGDRLAVGAVQDDGASNALVNSGAIYLFSFADTDFSGGQQEAVIGAGYATGSSLDVTTLDAIDQFGITTSLNAVGDRLAVGAHSDDGLGNTVNAAGAAYLFSFTDNNFSGGVLEAILGNGYTGGKNIDLGMLEANDQFGISVSLNGAGDRLAAGAYVDDGAADAIVAPGAVYLFSFTDTNFSGGTHEGTIGSGYSGGKNVDVAALEANDYFGRSVSLNSAGDRLAVSATGDDGAGNTLIGSGAVYLFSFTDGDFTGGTLEATLGAGLSGGKNIDMTALETSDQFGTSVALNGAGNRLAVGAPGDGGAGNALAGSGAAYLFSFADTSFSGGGIEATIGAGYTGGKNIDLTVLDANDVFGTSVSLNAAGDLLAVGAVFDDGASNAVVSSGAVHLFSFADTTFSDGALDATIGAGYSGGRNLDVARLALADQLGSSVSLNAAGDRLAVGARTEGGAGDTAIAVGAVYLFADVTTPITLTPTTNFADWSTDTITLAAADIVALLDDGTAVTLQASNDLTVAEAITVTGSPASIGTLTLQAGRSILVDADITTTAGGASGAVSLFANDLLSSGVIDAERDPGAAVVTMAPGTRINAGAAQVSIELRDGAGKTHTTSGDITLEDITAGTITVLNEGPTAGSGVTLNAGAVLSASAATGTSIELVGDHFTNNAGAGALVTSGTGRFLVWSGSPAGDLRGSLAHDFKQYNAVRGVTAVAGAAGEDGFLYSIAPTLTPGLTGSIAKTYDGTDTATLAPGNITATGAIDGDTVTLNAASATYDDRNVGTGKTVTANGISVASASNAGVTVFGYQPSSTSANAAIGAITPAALTITVDDATREEGQPNPILTYRMSGFVPGDGAGLVSGLAIGTVANAGSPAGLYPIVASGASAPNYDLTYVDGVLTVTAAAPGVVLTPITLSPTANRPLQAAQALYEETRREGLETLPGLNSAAQAGEAQWAMVCDGSGIETYAQTEFGVNLDGAGQTYLVGSCLRGAVNE